METQPAEKLQPQRKIRVMIVDDSAVIRTVISRTLREQDDMEIVAVAMNGDMAVKAIKQADPDIVVLDIEMPIMDGLTALPLLLKEKPGTKVLICSTLSSRGADISVRALGLGAADYILKPGGDAIVSAKDFQDGLVRVVRTLAAGLRKFSSPALKGGAKKPITLRKDPVIMAPRILAIGSSTGGPRVLMDILGHLKGLSVPIVITQHMPKTFTAMLAQHITQTCGLPCEEGAEGTVLQAGRAYIAPGGYHMILQKRGEQTVIHLDEGAPENYCRPSVNPMLRSLMEIYGNRILSVILTGMGNDGSQVCADLVKAGGHVIAQDEETSTVWGMPAAVANAGVCSAVLPPQGLVDWIKNVIKQEAPK